MATCVAVSAPICPACTCVITPSNESARPWGEDGPLLHAECAADVAAAYRTHSAELRAEVREIDTSDADRFDIRQLLLVHTRRV